MLIGRVRGTVVSTHKAEALVGAKLLIVQPVDLTTMELKDDYVICVDDIGAGDGDIVMCAYGSSARQTDSSKQFASDFSIHAIVDHLTIKDKKTYEKSKDAYDAQEKENKPCN